jgi:YfiH family protein
MKPVQSSLLEKVPGLAHGFGTKDEPIPNQTLPAWNALKPSWKQVHKADVAHITYAHQNCGEVDALWTRELGLPIAVVTADCVPILLARKDGKAVAAVHAGWRGTHAHILSALWEKLRAQGESPSEWVAAVGPAIGPCCYEVSEEIAQDFKQEFASLGENLAVPRHRILDLPTINAKELERIGVAEVDLLRYCTRCNEAFHSYRREGGGTRQYSMVMIQKAVY